MGETCEAFPIFLVKLGFELGLAGTAANFKMHKSSKQISHFLRRCQTALLETCLKTACSIPRTPWFWVDSCGEGTNCLGIRTSEIRWTTVIERNGQVVQNHGTNVCLLEILFWSPKTKILTLRSYELSSKKLTTPAWVPVEHFLKTVPVGYSSDLVIKIL